MKKIALVDHLDGGHHLAFMRLFAQALLELGHEVWVFYPYPDAVRGWVDTNHPNLTNNISYFEISLNDQPANKWFGRFTDAIRALRLWQQVGQQIKQAERLSSKKVDLVFFNWMDSFLANYLPLTIHRLVFKYRWSGLYFHPYHLRLEPESLNRRARFSSKDYLFTSPRCESVALHDAYISEKFSKRLNGRKVIIFPEVADDTSPDPNNELALSIKRYAKGRTIVGLIGLVAYKGLSTLIQVANIAESNRYYFLISGNLNIQKYTKDQQEIIQDYLKKSPENSFIYLKNLEEGLEFNSIFNCLDIPFIAYDNFISSSNNLTKAAQLRKKVVASKGYCIGEDVEKYGLGCTVIQGNAEQGLNAINQLSNELNLNLAEENLFEEYSKINSTRTLKFKFEELIQSVKKWHRK